MQIRRFYANTLSGAMRDIRRALGPDAFIMSSRQLPADHKVYMQDGSRPRFEVTAAVESTGAGGNRPVHEFQPVTRPPSRPGEKRPARNTHDEPNTSDHAQPRKIAGYANAQTEVGDLPQETGHRATTATKATDAQARIAGLLRKARPPVQPEMKNVLAATGGSVLKRSFQREGGAETTGRNATDVRTTDEQISPPSRPMPTVLKRVVEKSRNVATLEDAADNAEESAAEAGPSWLPQKTSATPSVLEGIGSVAELREIVEDLKALRQQLREERAVAATATTTPASAQTREAQPEQQTEETRADEDTIAPRPTRVFAGDMTARQGENSTILPARDLQHALRGQGVDEKLLQRILERMHFDPESGPNRQGSFQKLVQVVQDFIPQTEPIEPQGNGPRLVVMTGPTGVGKTTTIAKIASHHALMENQRVGLITLDTCRVGAAEQLKTYARLLGVPAKVQSDPTKLVQTIDEYADMDLVLVDTPGLSPVDVASFERLCQAVRPLRDRAEIHLEMTASTRGAEMRRIMEIYRPLCYNRLIFSKMDESGCWGELLNTWIMGGTSVSYFTTGQRVPEDFEEATVEALCEALVTEL